MRLRTLHACALLFVTTSIFASFSGTDLILPAVGRVDGVAPTQFYTTVWVTNMNATPVDFDIAFLPTGQANLNPARVTQTIAPGATKTYENIAETLFGIKGVLGAARIRSSADLIVSSRIYNQLPTDHADNSVGLYYGAVPARFGLAKGESATLQGVRQNADFRYNIFAVESSGAPATLRLRIRNANGDVVAETLVPLQAFEQRLVSAGAFVKNFDDGVIEATTTDGDGRVIVAGSQVTNGSNDASGFEMALRSDSIGNGTITGVTAGAGLTGGGTSGNVTLGIAPGAVVRSINGLTDIVTLYAGLNTTITSTTGGITISSTGAPGPQGPQGLAGPIGPAGLNWRGAWLNTMGYLAHDAVSFNGSSYVALAANTNAQPDTSPGIWSLIAAGGTITSTTAGGELAGTYPNPTVVATSTNTANSIIRRDASGNFAAGTITGTLNGNATGFTGALAGDVTGTQSATLVSAVGGQTAASIAAGTIAANTATNLNTASTIVKRDASGNFAAGTITGTLNGNATGFTGVLAGDVTGTQSATVVATVGGQTAANVAAATSRVLTMPNPLQLAIGRWYQANMILRFPSAVSDPFAMAFDGEYMWTADSQVSTAEKRRANDATSGGTFSLSYPAWTAAYDGANVWFGGCGSADAITLLRARDGANVGTIIISAPCGLAFDGSNMWVGGLGGVLTKVRATDGATLASASLGGNIFSVVFDGTDVWTANGAAVLKVRASDAAVLGSTPIAGQPRGVTFDGAYVWSNNLDGTVTKIRASDGVVVATVSLPDGASPVTPIVFDGAYIWAASSGNVTKIRATDGAIVAIVPVGTVAQLAFDGANVWGAIPAAAALFKM